MKAPFWGPKSTNFEGPRGKGAPGLRKKGAGTEKSPGGRKKRALEEKRKEKRGGKKSLGRKNWVWRNESSHPVNLFERAPISASLPPFSPSKKMGRRIEKEMAGLEEKKGAREGKN